MGRSVKLEMKPTPNIGAVGTPGPGVAASLRLLGDRLIADHVIDPRDASARARYESLARATRDLLAPRWVETERTWDKRNAKRVYYLSMEFLIGASLRNNLAALGLEGAASEACREGGLELDRIIDEEPDAGLGNGGLGRLAACFIDSLATLELPFMGYGLRYEYGIFRQLIRDGWQHEEADNWLCRPDPWAVVRDDEGVEIRLSCGFDVHEGTIRAVPWRPSTLIAVPHDRPVVGWGGRAIGTLRMWSTRSPTVLDFGRFSGGDYVASLAEMLTGETITRVLYPDDSTTRGKGLRFVQQAVLSMASIADLVRRFRRMGKGWGELHQHAAIQLNDTHPAFAVSELMRVLLDDAGLGWDEAWDISQRTLAYTNHTLLPEALEKWPVRWFELLVPRQLEIIYEINRRHLNEVAARIPGDTGRLRAMSLIDEQGERRVCMAHLATVASHRVNGVSAIHSELLRTTVLRDFAELAPDRFCNVTNGITPRRWLRVCNPLLARVITDAIGDGWICDAAALSGLAPLAEDAGFRDAVREAHRILKRSFADWLVATHNIQIDPGFMFDCHIKRIHEYKRQLLNALEIVMLINRLRDDPGHDTPPQVFLFAGKAAPAYHFAKLIIKLINNIAATIDTDPRLRERIRVVFVPDYSVSVAERMIPASDVSEQISTAGFEASGTGNMKFMMNGALTLGTRDGATIEMVREAGEQNMFLFGLSAQQVAGSRDWYSPWWHYENEPEIRGAIDAILSDRFSPTEQGVFAPIGEALLQGGDRFMHLADLTAYAAAREAVRVAYRDTEAWTRRSVLNIAASGWFSSDRTIREYADKIWGVSPCEVGPSIVPGESRGHAPA